MKRIATILSIAAAIGPSLLTAQNEHSRVATDSYTTISNIMKTKHETVKNTLNNVR